MKNKKIILNVLEKYSNTLIKNGDLDIIVDDVLKNLGVDVDRSDITAFVKKHMHASKDHFVIFSEKKTLREKKAIFEQLENTNNFLDTTSEKLENATKILENTAKQDDSKQQEKYSGMSVDQSEEILVEEDNESMNTEELEREIEESFNIYKEKKGYIYPKETIQKIRKIDPVHGPYGTQWIHDHQIDDILDEAALEKVRIFNELAQIPVDEQCSPAWFKARESRITASDIGTVLGDNKHSAAYEFIMKKVAGGGFPGNEFTYHGKKYEKIATMVYEYRMNVQVHEFGMICHPDHYFLGASPDGIVNEYKNDGKHKTKHVGRMLEIKCPYRRKINTEGEIKDHICPIYYWDQVQLQLECCNLEECDFWQCNIYEYSSRSKFLEDTDLTEPFRSKETGLEKGCVIQLLKKIKAGESMDNYNETVYNNSTFVYPDKVEMSPYDVDVWIANKMEEIRYDEQYKDYYIDKIIYWRLNNAHSCTIIRERDWFTSRLPTMKKIWNYVEFFRENQDLFKLLQQFVDSMAKKNKNEIMNKIAELYDSSFDKNNNKTSVMEGTANQIKKNTVNKTEKILKRATTSTNANKNFENYMF